jgi:ATP-binding cassette, subfamily B, bacterial
MNQERVMSSLGRLLRRGKGGVPYVQQMQWSDCGAACLTMVLAYNGKEIPLAKVRDTLGIARDGVSARQLADGGRRFGLLCRAVKADVEQIELLPTGAVLHWEFNHFVVFDRILSNGVRIVDPATGPRDVPLAAFAESFTGVALLFEPAPEFKPEKGLSQWARLKRWARELMAERRLFQRIVVLSLVLRLMALSLPLLTGVIVDQVVPRADYDLLVVASLAVVMMTLFNGLFGVVRTYLLTHLRVVLDLRSTLGFLDHMVRLPFQFFQQRSDGDLMMRLGSNSTVREMVTSKSLAAILDGVFVLVYGAVVVAVNAKLGAIVFGLVVLEMLVFMVARGRYQRLMAENLEKDARSQSYLVQLLGGIETLKTAGEEQRAVEHYSNLYVEGQNVNLRRTFLDARVDAIREGIAGAAPLILLALGATAVMRGEMTLGSMLAVNSLATSLFGPLSELIGSALDLQLVRSHVDRVDDVLHTEPEQDVAKVRTPHELGGAIAGRGLRFRYAENMPYVVDGVNVDIPAGKSVAIVGPSGSGKTTLLNLLAGLYKPSEGSIFYDGRAVAELDAVAVRRQVGFVPQHPYVFGASIRENIALTRPEATLDQVIAAARAACLHDDVDKMPMSYDTPVSDGGASLSGGQRQRIALARAVLRQPKALFLDEGTSALDNATEARVIANLDCLPCTRLTVAHRLSTVRNADVILVMVGGKLVEQGSHDELYAQGGEYYRLVAASQRGDDGGSMSQLHLVEDTDEQRPTRAVAGARLPAGGRRVLRHG